MTSVDMRPSPDVARARCGGARGRSWDRHRRRRWRVESSSMSCWISAPSESRCSSANRRPQDESIFHLNQERLWCRTRPAFVPPTTRRRQETIGTAGASNPQVRNQIRPSPQVAKSAPRTLSRWRHGFEPRWDYEYKGQGQGASLKAFGGLNGDSTPNIPRISRDGSRLASR
jgi:hypothetical protein